MTQQNTGGSCRKGILGAVLGALLGGVVLALCHSLGVLAAALGFFVGYLAKQGYRLLGGSSGYRLTVLIVIAALAVIVATLLGYRINWFRENGGDGYMFSLYMEYAVWSLDFMIRMLMGILFAVLGVLNLGSKK